jgi:head-tail adaptor
MAYAGDYYDRATRLIRSVSKNAQNGQEEEAFAEGNTLWCRIDYATGRKQKDFGADQTGIQGTIYVRNYPTLSPLDRLYAADYGETWIIETIRKGSNELICEAYLYDELEL